MSQSNTLDQNLPNGIPATYKPPTQPQTKINLPVSNYQFNGLGGSTHSSRNSSPGLGSINLPQSQLAPSRLPIPANQLPPSRNSSEVSQLLQTYSHMKISNNQGYQNYTPQSVTAMQKHMFGAQEGFLSQKLESQGLQSQGFQSRGMLNQGSQSYAAQSQGMQNQDVQGIRIQSQRMLNQELQTKQNKQETLNQEIKSNQLIDRKQDLLNNLEIQNKGDLISKEGIQSEEGIQNKEDKQGMQSLKNNKEYQNNVEGIQKQISESQNNNLEPQNMNQKMQDVHQDMKNVNQVLQNVSLGVQNPILQTITPFSSPGMTKFSTSTPIQEKSNKDEDVKTAPMQVNAPSPSNNTSNNSNVPEGSLQNLVSSQTYPIISSHGFTHSANSHFSSPSSIQQSNSGSKYFDGEKFSNIKTSEAKSIASFPSDNVLKQTKDNSNNIKFGGSEHNKATQNLDSSQLQSASRNQLENNMFQHNLNASTTDGEQNKISSQNYDSAQNQLDNRLGQKYSSSDLNQMNSSISQPSLQQEQIPTSGGNLYMNQGKSGSTPNLNQNLLTSQGSTQSYGSNVPLTQRYTSPPNFNKNENQLSKPPTSYSLPLNQLGQSKDSFSHLQSDQSYFQSNLLQTNQTSSQVNSQSNQAYSQPQIYSQSNRVYSRINQESKQPTQSNYQVSQQYSQPTQSYPQFKQPLPQVTQSYSPSTQTYPQSTQSYSQSSQSYPQSMPSFSQSTQSYPRPVKSYPQSTQFLQQSNQNLSQPTHSYSQSTPLQSNQSYSQPTQSYPQSTQSYHSSAQTLTQTNQPSFTQSSKSKPIQSYSQPKQNLPQLNQSYPQLKQTYPPSSQTFQMNQSYVQPQAKQLYPQSNQPYPQSQTKPFPQSNYYQQTQQTYQEKQVHQNQYPTQAVPQKQNVYQQNVVQSGFNRLWGNDSVDLLQCPNILPPIKIEPPLATLGQETEDTANCSPEIFRCTMTKIPENNSLLQKSRLPLGVLIHPFKDLNHLPVIQCNAIVRCRACRTYINPYVFFVDSKRWKCNLCYRVNELPEEFLFDPVSKTYGDPTRRPEVKSSTIEYIAPAEYMVRPPQPAIYLFLLDVSRAAVESGYLLIFCNTLISELKNLPGDARTQIGFLAYDSALHFYSLAEGFNQPHELTVLDIDDVFLPSPDNLLVNLQDRMDLISDLLNHLPNRFLNTFETGSALGAALQAAHKMIASTGGRVTVFQASLPTIGPGSLTSREDPSQRASSDVQHLNPANDFYKRLALECSGQQISVDLFIINSHYIDLATISGISRFSGGCIHHFPLFKAERTLQSDLLERTFRRYLTRKIGFEAVMRIRCTRGLSIHTFHGNFFVRSTDLLSLPNINPDAGFGMQLAIDESLSDVQRVCFQAALLYTSSKGERRIRVHTLCLPVASTLHDIINSSDQQCIIGLLSKMAVDRSMQSSLSDAREAFINVVIDILSSYKLSLNMGSGMSGLLAPQCLKLLPLYVSALLKHTAFRTGTSTRLDDRIKAMCDMKARPLPYLIQQIYPDLYPIHNLEEQSTVITDEEETIPIPPLLQLSARSLDSDGAYLLDQGEHMIILVCSSVNLDFLNYALGISDYNSIPDQMYELPVLENIHNQRLHSFINYLNDDKPFAATMQIMRDDSHFRHSFFDRLIEDRIETALSYHEFLQHIKTQVK